ncbi:hypothetical protein BUE80_DR006396 [Diplocarpon rosae]|nr:hypothetical protein BUE80_DR006396 [Diplocarpon rosae]
MNGYTVTPHHRQNRRRERPGSRTRRTIPRKADIAYDLHEGLLDARDAEYYIPTDKTRPSPLLRQNFNQSWQRWQARKAEEKVLSKVDMTQSEKEQLMRFGGELGDDAAHQELYRLGVLYNNNDDLVRGYEPNAIACYVPVMPTVPIVGLRYSKPKHPQRRSTWRSLPIYPPLSLSSRSDDADILRLSSQASPIPTIRPRKLTPVCTNLPLQSLPPPAPEPQFLDDLVSVSSSRHLLDLTAGDWTLIHTPHHADSSLTPPSEPETWVLIDDS